MSKFTELAGLVGPVAFFRHPMDHWSDHLWYLDCNMQPKKSPWTSIPSEHQVAQYFGVLPWEKLEMPRLPLEVEPVSE